MSLKILIKIINQIIEAFEMGNENNAYELIRSIEPTFFKDVNTNNPDDNAEYMKAVERLSKFKDRFESDYPNFARHIHNLYSQI